MIQELAVNEIIQHGFALGLVIGGTTILVGSGINYAIRLFKS